MKFRALLFTSLMAGALQAATYSYVTSAEAVLVPGTTDIGNHCDDCTTTVSLPFSYMLYGTLYNSVVVSSNGNLQFTGNTSYLGSNGMFDSNLGISILGYQDDLRTDGTGGGIFTSLSGVGPNQIFNIEWRNTYFGRSGSADWEIRLYEGQQKFDLLFASTADSALSETIGVQQDLGDFTQFSSNTASVSNGEMISFSATAVPEPATAALFTLGGGLLLASRFLKKRLRG